MKGKNEGRKEYRGSRWSSRRQVGENHIHCPPPNQTLILCGSTSVGRSVGRSGNDRRRPTIFCIWLAAAFAAMATACLRRYRASLPMKDNPCDWLAATTAAASIHRPPLPLLQGWSVGPPMASEELNRVRRTTEQATFWPSMSFSRIPSFRLTSDRHPSLPRPRQFRILLTAGRNQARASNTNRVGAIVPEKHAIMSNFSLVYQLRLTQQMKNIIYSSFTPTLFWVRRRS